MREGACGVGDQGEGVCGYDCFVPAASEHTPALTSTQMEHKLAQTDVETPPHSKLLNARSVTEEAHEHLEEGGEDVLGGLHRDRDCGGVGLRHRKVVLLD